MFEIISNLSLPVFLHFIPFFNVHNQIRTHTHTRTRKSKTFGTLEMIRRSLLLRQGSEMGAILAELKAINTKVDAKFDSVNAKVDSKFDSVNARFDSVNAKFDSVNAEIKALNTNFDAKFDMIDKNMDTRWDSYVKLFPHPLLFTTILPTLM